MRQLGCHNAMCTLDPMALRPCLSASLPLALIIQIVINSNDTIISVKSYVFNKEILNILYKINKSIS